MLNVSFMNAVDERPGFCTGTRDRLKVVEIPANLDASWESAACELEHADPMDREQSGAHGVAESLVGAEDNPSTRAGVSGPHVIIKPLFGRAVHRPQGMHGDAFGAERIGKLVSP